MSWDLPELFLSVSELALASIPATSLLFPATAEFCLVKTQLPVVRARTVATCDGVLGDSGGGGGQPAVVCGGTNECAGVLALETCSSHQLRRSKIGRRVRLGWVKLVGEHGESGTTKSRRITMLRELLEVVGKELL